MKNEKGITLISLIVTIVIMLIIAGVATYSGMEAVQSSQKTAFISEMEMIQAKVNSIYEERKNNKEKIEYYNNIGQDISIIDETKLATLFPENNFSGFKYFNSNDLKKLDLYNINHEVLINYDTREVINLNGIEIEGTIYYKLKDIPNYVGFNIEYENKNTEAPTFSVEQIKLGNYEYRYTLKDIEYKSNVKGGTVSYKLHNDTNWILNGENTSFTVYKPGLYDIKYTDTAGNSTTIQKWIYVEDEVIAYYDGENNTGNGHDNTVTTWKDLSKNENDATITGLNNTENSGWGENKIILDGENDDIEFPVNIKQAGTFSLEIIFTEHDHKKQGLITSDKSWKAFSSHTWNDDGSIYIGGNYDEKRMTDRFSPNEINYKTTVGKTDSIVYTYDGNTRLAKFYANGKILAQKQFTTDPEEINKFIIFNAQKDYNRISFYKRVLTEEEISTNYEIDKYRFGI